jgi:hypothetical protein
MRDNELERASILQNLYLRNMQMIKWRFKAIDDIRQKRRTTTFEHTNIEFCILQIRKILELIALSSLVSDADIYRQELGRLERMWNAKLIFKDLERINPEFYPHPIYISPEDKTRCLEREEPYLTKEKFVYVYDRCGRFLHEDSPFFAEKQIEEEYRKLWDDIYEWGQLIINLLTTHVIKLCNHTRLFYISVDILGERVPMGNIFEEEKQ